MAVLTNVSIPKILVILLLSMLCREALAKPCVIKAKKASINGVVIHPPGEDSFQIALRKVPIALKPTAGQTSGALKVLGPLHFTTPHKLASLSFRVAKRTVLLDRRLVLEKGLIPVFTETRADLKYRQGSIILTLPLRELDTATQNIPCDALTIAEQANEYFYPPNLLPSKTKYVVEPKNRIPLYSSRKEEAPLWVRFDGWFSVVAQKQGWIRLRATWSDGSRLQGWVPRHLLQLERNRLADPLLLGAAGMGIEGCAWGHTPKRIQIHLRPNTPIRTGPGGATWAHASRAVKAVAFPARPDGWIRVATLRGIPRNSCMPHERIWVHQRDLVPEQ